jgi:hypothetical protein
MREGDGKIASGALAVTTHEIGLADDHVGNIFPCRASTAGPSSCTVSCTVPRS